MTKIIFLDTETTGLDPIVHGIHQLGGEIVINDKVVDKFDYRIKPFKGHQIDQKALDVSNTTVLELMKYKKEEIAFFNIRFKLQNYLEFNNEKDKFILAGWRLPEFDSKFLKELFKRYKAESEYERLFWSNTIDVKSLATQYLINERHKIESFSLAPIARYLGVEVDESQLHKASYDAYLCRKVYEIVTNTRIIDKKY